MVNTLKFRTLFACPKTNRADPDQTASEEAVWSGSSLFAILTSILWISALITNILFVKRKWKVFEILEHLLYMYLFCWLTLHTKYMDLLHRRFVSVMTCNVPNDSSPYRFYVQTAITKHLQERKRIAFLQKQISPPFRNKENHKIAFSYVTRGIIWKIYMQELWFLCIAFHLYVLYKCMKYL